MRTQRLILSLACCGLLFACGSDDGGELRSPAPRSLKGGKAEGQLDAFLHIPATVMCGSLIDSDKIKLENPIFYPDGTMVRVGRFDGMGLKSSHSFSFAGKAGYRFRFKLSYPTAPSYPRLGAYVYVYDAETLDLLAVRLAHQAYRSGTATLDSAYSHKYIIGIQSAKRSAHIDYQLKVTCERYAAIHTSALNVEPQGKMVVKLHNYQDTPIYANDCSTFFWEKYVPNKNPNIPGEWKEDRPASYCYHFGAEPPDGNMFLSANAQNMMTDGQEDCNEDAGCDVNNAAPAPMIWGGGVRKLNYNEAIEQTLWAPSEPGTYRLVSSFSKRCSSRLFFDCQGWKTVASAMITVKPVVGDCKMIEMGTLGGTGVCVDATGSAVEKSCCEKTCDAIQAGYTATVEEGKQCDPGAADACKQEVQSRLGGCFPSCQVYINSTQASQDLDALKGMYTERGCYILDWSRICPMYAAFESALAMPELPNPMTGICVTEYDDHPWINPPSVPVNPVLEDASETIEAEPSAMIWMPCPRPKGAICKDKACPPVMCEKYCENGFQLDEHGCEVCVCK